MHPQQSPPQLPDSGSAGLSSKRLQIGRERRLSAICFHAGERYLQRLDVILDKKPAKGRRV